MSKTFISILLLILVASAAANLQCPQKEDINGTICENETDGKICRSNETCEEEHSCPCRKGFTQESHGSTISCTDINECRDKRHVCGDYTECVNAPGSYYCECNKGFQKRSKTEFCPDFNNRSNNRCEDINECLRYPFPCAKYICRNAPGTYACTCNAGFRNTALDPHDPKCVDIKECEESPHICGDNSECNELIPYYNCTCKTGFRSKTKDAKNPQCSPCNKKVGAMQECSGDKLRCFLQYLNSPALPTCSELKEPQLQQLRQFLSQLGNLSHNIGSRPKEERLKHVGELLIGAEKLSRNLAIFYRDNIELQDPTSRTELRTFTNFSSREQVFLRSGWNSVTLDGSTAANNNTLDLPIVGILVYHRLSTLFKDANVLGQNSTVKEYSVISPVISTFVTREDTENLTKPITLRLTHSSPIKNHSITLCVFWSKENSAWSGKGCHKVNSTENETVCECSHMTSFAILMALEDIESWGLTLVTKIGLSLSIICLTLALITFCFCRSIRGTRNTIHTHLCATLLLGNCIFLLGIEAYHNKTLCSVVAGVLHALYLSSFCWMALEGLELYLMLVKVFDTHYLKKRHLVMVGYGVPLIIVIISAAIYSEGYGTEKYCWLSRKNGFVWSFMGPVCVIILVNCGIFVLTVWKLAEKMASLNPDQGKLKRIRSLTVTSVAQLCVLGCCWLFGFLMFGEAIYVFAYIFAIFNGLQGLQIFLLHCLLHRKVREEYAKWLCAAVHFKTPTYSEFSNSSNTHTQSKSKNTNKESNL